MLPEGGRGAQGAGGGAAAGERTGPAAPARSDCTRGFLRVRSSLLTYLLVLFFETVK